MNARDKLAYSPYAALLTFTQRCFDANFHGHRDAEGNLDSKYASLARLKNLLALWFPSHGNLRIAFSKPSRIKTNIFGHDVSKWS
jgi:hypothetical protein